MSNPMIWPEADYVPDCNDPFKPRDGMSLRGWFAGQALAGINANTAADAAALCYAIADAMLAARNEPQVNPLQAELDEARQSIKALESLRPHWAQGYSSDSMAAQSKTAALSDIWEALGASNQTEAMGRLRKLAAREATK